MLTRMWSTLISWLNIFFGARRDGWAAQAAAESGKNTTNNIIGKMLTIALTTAAAVTTAMWWWIDQAGPTIQYAVLKTGWDIASTMTITLTTLAIIKIFKPTRGYRP